MSSSPATGSSRCSNQAPLRTRRISRCQMNCAGRDAPYCMCPYATRLIASPPKPSALPSSSPSCWLKRFRSYPLAHPDDCPRKLSNILSPSDNAILTSRSRFKLRSPSLDGCFIAPALQSPEGKTCMAILDPRDRDSGFVWKPSPKNVAGELRVFRIAKPNEPEFFPKSFLARVPAA